MKFEKVFNHCTCQNLGRESLYTWPFDRDHLCGSSWLRFLFIMVNMMTPVLKQRWAQQQISIPMHIYCPRDKKIVTPMALLNLLCPPNFIATHSAIHNILCIAFPNSNADMSHTCRNCDSAWSTELIVGGDQWLSQHNKQWRSQDFADGGCSKYQMRVRAARNS